MALLAHQQARHQRPATHFGRAREKGAEKVDERAHGPGLVAQDLGDTEAGIESVDDDGWGLLIRTGIVVRGTVGNVAGEEIGKFADDKNFDEFGGSIPIDTNINITLGRSQ